MLDLDTSKWVDDTSAKIEYVHDYKVSTFVFPPLEVKAIHRKWIYNTCVKPMINVETSKARPIAKYFTQYGGIDSQEHFFSYDAYIY